MLVDTAPMTIHVQPVIHSGVVVAVAVLVPSVKTPTPAITIALEMVE
jgi:hypothetical protein